ncbi:MAG: hypothetical protein KF713_11230 [Turneriella sp.]|nr:hypothetical protein [Turneriella sp.]
MMLVECSKEENFRGKLDVSNRGKNKPLSIRGIEMRKLICVLVGSGVFTICLNCSDEKRYMLRVKNPLGITESSKNLTIPYGETLQSFKKLNPESYIGVWKNSERRVDKHDVCEISGELARTSETGKFYGYSASELKEYAYRTLKDFYRDDTPQEICRVNENEIRIFQVQNIDCKNKTQKGVAVFFMNHSENLLDRVVFKMENNKLIPVAFGGKLLHENSVSKELKEIQNDKALFNARECNFDH